MTELPEANDDAARRDEELAAYLEAAAAGQRVDRAAMASSDPEIAEFLAQHDRLAELGSWWRMAAGEGGATTVRWSGAAQFPAPEENPRLPELPGYEMLREIARGGMGVVYEARQTSLSRPVAVKLVLHGALASGDDRRRFAAEAAAAAKLKHPGIVVVHEVGEHAGQPFFSMEFVAGESLSKMLRRGLPTAKQAARFVTDTARAVQYAHEHGVLHRDVKPSNVLVDESGRVRVTDFGLSKQIDADEKLTVTGQLLGTPSYMAPEQVTGPVTAVGPACDVYGLGALLYELLTGQPPFRGDSQVETLIDVLESDPPLPRRLNPAVPRPLEMVALKCLEKNPADRYPSAGAVAADLERFLEGETLSISSPKLLDRLMRALERSQFDRQVYLVSRLLVYVAAIALVTHVLMFVNYVVKPTHPQVGVLALRLAEVAAMGALFWRWREVWHPLRGPAARQVAAIWLGYLVGSFVLVAVDWLMAPPADPYFGLRAYPGTAVLAGLVFLVLGSSYWGYCYLVGGLFFILAVAMAAWLPAAPLLFGFCWAASLVLLGTRLGRLGGGD